MLQDKIALYLLISMFKSIHKNIRTAYWQKIKENKISTIDETFSKVTS